MLVPVLPGGSRFSVAQTTRTSRSAKTLSELWRHPIHTREFGSQITNVLRSAAGSARLRGDGDRAWSAGSIRENELIASYKGAARGNARQRNEQILHELNLDDARALVY